MALGQPSCLGPAALLGRGHCFLLALPAEVPQSPAAVTMISMGRLGLPRACQREAVSRVSLPGHKWWRAVVHKPRAEAKVAAHVKAREVPQGSGVWPLVERPPGPSPATPLPVVSLLPGRRPTHPHPLAGAQTGWAGWADQAWRGGRGRRGRSGAQPGMETPARDPSLHLQERTDVPCFLV